jgi:hypothetical protein
VVSALTQHGFFFVSGKQQDGLAAVPAAAPPDGTIVMGRTDSLAGAIENALVHQPQVANWALDVPCVGPEAARLGTKAVLRMRNVKNAVLGQARLVYLPVAISGGRCIGPGGAFPYALDHMHARMSALNAAAMRARGYDHRARARTEDGRGCAGHALDELERIVRVGRKATPVVLGTIELAPRKAAPVVGDDGEALGQELRDRPEDVSRAVAPRNEEERRATSQ